MTPYELGFTGRLAELEKSAARGAQLGKLLRMGRAANKARRAPVFPLGELTEYPAGLGGIAGLAAGAQAGSVGGLLGSVAAGTTLGTVLPGILAKLHQRSRPYSKAVRRIPKLLRGIGSEDLAPAAVRKTVGGAGVFSSSGNRHGELMRRIRDLRTSIRTDLSDNRRHSAVSDSAKEVLRRVL